MKSLSFVFVSLLFCAGIHAQNSFSGEWKLNAEKTQFGNIPKFVIPQQVNIKLGGDSVRMEFININAEGVTQPAASASYAVDGSKSEKVVDDSTARSVSVVLMSDINLSRNLSFYPKGHPDQPAREVEERWGVSPDGKSLMFAQTIKFKDSGGYEVTGYYDRVK